MTDEPSLIEIGFNAPGVPVGTDSEPLYSYTATAYTAYLASSELYLALRSKLFREIFLTNLWRD